MQVSKESMLCYVVSDRTWLQGRSLHTVMQQCIDGGATFLQLREKTLDHERFLQEANDIKRVAKKAKIPFVINDDVSIFREVDADGIHIGQDDGNVADLRASIGAHKILGVSVQTVEQACKAQQDGADYLGVGSVFTTTTKLDADAVSFETLQAICASVQIPVIAIGGIHLKNIKQLAHSGIDGVAVISAILASDNIIQAIQTIKQEAQSVVTL